MCGYLIDRMRERTDKKYRNESGLELFYFLHDRHRADADALTDWTTSSHYVGTTLPTLYTIPSPLQLSDPLRRDILLTRYSSTESKLLYNIDANSPIVRY